MAPRSCAANSAAPRACAAALQNLGRRRAPSAAQPPAPTQPGHHPPTISSLRLPCSPHTHFQIELKKNAPKQQKLSNGSKAAGGGAVGGGDAEMADAAGPSTSGTGAHAGPFTGRYQLSAVLTHKGRSADSGHYVAWVRQADSTWALFDDDQIITKTQEDVLALSGGGDWHMAYLIMYTAVRAPSAAPKAAAAADGAAGGEAAGDGAKADAAAAPAPMES